jgi:hypothetical protein
VDEAWFYHLNAPTLASLRKRFSRQLAIADAHFWQRQSRMRYASLMKVSHPTPLDKIPCAKRDRRGWVPLQ